MKKTATMKNIIGSWKDLNKLCTENRSKLPLCDQYSLQPVTEMPFYLKQSHSVMGNSMLGHFFVPQFYLRQEDAGSYIQEWIMRLSLYLRIW